jgi:serine protease Do
VAIGVVSVGPREIAKEGGVLGIVLEEGGQGVRVTQVMPESGAAKAGILIDDLVTRCNGKDTKDRQTLVTTVRQYGPGDEIELTLLRGGKEMKIKATLSRSIQGWKPDRREVQNNMGGKLSERRHGFPSALQHDSVLQPTECGGPIVDLEGRALGINVARAGRTETYAVPADVVRSLLADLMSGKLAPLPENGATVSISTAAAEQPLEVGQPPEPREE